MTTYGRVYRALLNERDIQYAQGVLDVSLMRSQVWEPHTVVIMYKCHPMPLKIIREETVNTPAKVRYYEDTIVAIYIRGRRAQTALVWRDYVDVITKPHITMLEKVTRSYWGDD